MLGEPLVLGAPSRRRRALRGRAARGRDGDRPRAHADRAAAQARRRRARSSSSAATGSRRSRWPTARRSRTCRPSTARRPRSSRSTTRRCATCARPAAASCVPTRRRATRRSRACSGATATPTPAFDALVELDLDERRAEPRRPEPAAGPRARWPTCPPASAALGTRDARAAALNGKPTSAARRRRRDRRDHVVHEHLEPVGDGRRGPARAQRRRARPARRAARQDEPRPRLARRHRLPRGRRACRSRSTRSASSSSATAARPASATRARSRTRSPQAVRDGELAVCAVLSGNRNFEGRIHPLRARELPRLSPARRRLRARGLDRRRPRARAARHRRARAPTSSCATSGPRAARSRRPSRRALTPELFEREYATHLGRRRALARAAGARRARSSPGTRLHLRARAVVLPGICSRAGAARRHRRRALPRRCSATRSRPTTSRRPARSRATCPPAAT